METERDAKATSLDAVDLNSLLTSQRHSDDGAVGLCSTSNLDSKTNKHNEVVIKADDKEQGLNEPVVKNVICYICDINVPEVYFNVHKNGFRHKFNKKVADTALKRLQLYVDKEYNNGNNEQLPSKHFCVECSIVINSEDEASHKQTTAHENSVLLERVFNDFLFIYTNNDKDIETKPIQESNTYIQEYILDEPITEETLTINSLTNSDEQKSKTETVTNIKKEKENIKETKEDERTDKKILKTNPREFQEEELSKKHLMKHKKIPRHIFNTISDYHYLLKLSLDDDNVYCVVCKEAIPNDMDIIKRHFDSQPHVKKYDELLKAHNIVRRYEKKYYCKECKVYILHNNEYMHIKTVKHSERMGFSEMRESDEQSDVSADSADADDTEAALVNGNTIEANSGTTTDNATVEPANSTALEALNQRHDTSRSTNNHSDMKTAFDNFRKSIASWLVDINKKRQNPTRPAVSEGVEPNEESAARGNSYVCGVCNVKVGNNGKCILEHNRGRGHNIKLLRYIRRR